MPRANRLSPAEVCRIEFDVDFPPGHAAAYLLPADEPILVDAGTLGSEGEADLREGLAACGYEPSDVAHVLLTHLHADHVGQAGTLRETADATLHVPSTFRDRLDRGVDAIERASRASLLAAGVDEAAIDRLLPEFLRSEEVMRDVLSPETVDHWIEPGEPATVGSLALDPVHAPGHHVTHVCYAADLGEDRSLFSGDMAIEPFRALTIHAGFDEGVADGIDAYYSALDRLAGLDVDRVFPGHGPVHTDFDGAIERSVAGLDRRLDACESKLRDEGSTALHVAGNLSAAEREAGRLLTEVVAALATLEHRGRASSTRRDGVRYYEPV